MELFALLLDAFRMDAPQKLHRISEHVADRNFNEARIEAHSLKGAAATVGAERIGILAGELENLMQQLAAEASTDTVDALSDPINTAVTLHQRLAAELESLNKAIDNLASTSADRKPD
ncbi:MAG: Hpt domain-containing protein [Halodesulfovibrio sp.]